MSTTIENVMTWQEAQEKLGEEILESMAQRKYVFVFTDSGVKQYASANDPEDESEGWSMGYFVE